MSHNKVSDVTSQFTSTPQATCFTQYHQSNVSVHRLAQQQEIYDAYLHLRKYRHIPVYFHELSDIAFTGTVCYSLFRM
jgi:hypothetical protein